jgi:hypothetical protein
VQELGKESEELDGGWTRTVVEMLRQMKKMIKESLAITLDENTKVPRQACFMENFKRRWLMGHGACLGMTLLADANHCMFDTFRFDRRKFV